jgi:hypothetical protein
MPRLVPGIHDFLTSSKVKTWMAGTSPAMTKAFALFALRRPAGRRQLKTIERESGRDRAADKRPFAKAFRCLPDTRGDCYLRHFTCTDVAAQTKNLFLGAVY